MSEPAAAKVKNLEVCYFERKDLVEKKKLLKILLLILRKKRNF